jgi:hypothetical protein
LHSYALFIVRTVITFRRRDRNYNLLNPDLLAMSKSGNIISRIISRIICPCSKVSIHTPTADKSRLRWLTNLARSSLPFRPHTNTRALPDDFESGPSSRSHTLIRLNRISITCNNTTRHHKARANELGNHLGFGWLLAALLSTAVQVFPESEDLTQTSPQEVSLSTGKLLLRCLPAQALLLRLKANSSTASPRIPNETVHRVD